MFVYRSGGGDSQQTTGIFTNLDHDDKQAFFSLLDEYFASRPHLMGGGGGGSGGAAHAAHAAPAAPPSRPSNYPPAPNPSSRPGGSSSTPAPPPSRSSGGGGGPTAFVNSGLGKVAGNEHVSGALGKIGAAGFAKSMDKKFNTPASRHGTGMSAPAKPASGTTAGRSIGHIDTTSAGAALKTMWTNDPNYQKPTSAPTAHALPPPQRGGAVLPPPTRKVDAPEAAPAYSSAGKVKALYDYQGGDDTDLPMQAGQIVTIVDKTSDDWWTCKDDSGRQGLVPANYVEEL